MTSVSILPPGRNASVVRLLSALTVLLVSQGANAALVQVQISGGIIYDMVDAGSVDLGRFIDEHPDFPALSNQLAASDGYTATFIVDDGTGNGAGTYPYLSGQIAFHKAGFPDIVFTSDFPGFGNLALGGGLFINGRDAAPNAFGIDGYVEMYFELFGDPALNTTVLPTNLALGSLDGMALIAFSDLISYVVQMSVHSVTFSEITPVPVPPAFLLFGSGVALLASLRRRHGTR